jgi:hypothetical protein
VARHVREGYYILRNYHDRPRAIEEMKRQHMVTAPQFDARSGGRLK